MVKRENKRGTLVVILGAGRPFHGDEPSALVETLLHKRVLDWIFEAFAHLPDVRFHFVGGYRIEAVIALYPELKFSVNPGWRDSRGVESLMHAPLDEAERVVVCYADTVFRRETVDTVLAVPGEVVFGVDCGWRSRYEGRSAEDLAAAERIDVGGGEEVEFTGMVSIAGVGLEVLSRLKGSERRDEVRMWALPRLFEFLRSEEEVPVGTVDIENQWAELNAPQDLARFVLGTKAETLDRLRPLLKHGEVGEQVRLTLGQWGEEREVCLGRVREKFAGRSVVVRSSALTEDGWAASNAGGFDSVLDVDVADEGALGKAIDDVVRSYGDGDTGHQILVQEMLRDVALSGVLFTRTLDRGAPYYVVNYDDQTASTDSVTGGHGEGLRTVLVRRSKIPEVAGVDGRLVVLLEMVVELEGLVGYDSLDIEFAISSAGQVHVLQVRPIAVTHRFHQVPDEKISGALEAAKQQFSRWQKPTSQVLGERVVFAVMPDWNPAEIVGTKPRPLALSLYQRLITNGVWAQQRAEYGYRDLRPQPLIPAFVGHPYVDTRASFNSFIPAGVSEGLAEKLAEHYTAELVAKPHLHDKVEFDIAFTCWFAGIERTMEERLPAEFFSAAVRGALCEALVEVTKKGAERLEEDFAALRILGERYEGHCAGGVEGLKLVWVLLDDCRRFGTPAFSHLARAGFVAVTILKSFVREQVISGGEYDRFMNSLRTVVQELEDDAYAVAEGRMEMGDLVGRYGHLRPGTYDILSETYHEDPEKYFGPTIAGAKSRERELFAWDEGTAERIDGSLEVLGISAGEFESMARRAIEGREYGKFVFTKNLSRALDELQAWGAGFGLGREDLAYLNMNDLEQVRLGVMAADVGEWLSERAEEGRDCYRLACAVELPSLIFSERDFDVFEKLSTEPNYVTGKRVTVEVVVLENGVKGGDPGGKIVMIPQADPGFDWLFGTGIVGLVTMYGGANSHMAIRAAELGLPAAIGVGDKLFDQLRGAAVIDLNCGAQTITAVR